MIELRRMEKKFKIENSKSMISSVSDDILEEILIRLPNLKSLIQCSTVCKRWLSIINSYFIANFINYHRTKKPSSLLTLVLGQKLDSRSLWSFSVRVASLVDSFPNMSNLLMHSTLIATCGDLLLVKISDSYIVCNPLTGQKFLLPDPPTMTYYPLEDLYLAMAGIVSEPEQNKNNDNKEGASSSSCSCSRRYRVMLIFYSRKMRNKEKGLHKTLFCSQTGQWTIPIHAYASFGNYDFVASNGRFYRLYLVLKLLVSFDPFKDKRGKYIKLPDGISGGFRYHAQTQLRLGLFQGQPPLSQLLRVDGSDDHLCLKIWDLKYTSSFDLVHQVKIKANWMSLFVLAFHPSHNNQIFMLRDRHIYQYDIENEKQIKVAEILSDYNGKTKPDLRVFPYVHPACPTLII